MYEERLKEVLAAHEEWLASGKTRGRQASLARQDLRFAVLDGVDLTEAILSEVNLERTSLAGARLDRADLRGANLMYANATGAQLSHANLAGGRLEGVRLDGANLTEAKLAGAALEHASLRQAKAAGVNAAGAKLLHADLTLCDLEHAVLTGADFSGATLAYANLRGASADQARLARATLTGADVYGASFRDADLRDAVLISVKLASATTDNAKIDGAWGGATHQDAASSTEGDPRPVAAGTAQRARLGLLTHQLEQARSALRRSAPTSPEAQQLDLRILEIEDQRKIAAHDIERAEQEALKVQADFAARIEAAVAALRGNSGARARQVTRLRAWGITLKVLALSTLAATLASLTTPGARSLAEVTLERLGGSPLTVAVLLLLTAGLFWLDLKNGRELNLLLQRRARVDEAAALLSASQFISRDHAGTQQVIDQSFALIRESVLQSSATDATERGRRGG